MTTALDRFIEKARALFAGEPDTEKRWSALRPVLSELLADPAVLETSRTWPEAVIKDNQVDNLLFYEDPDYKFVINGLVTGASGFKGAVASLIHDHAHLYTLFGLLDGNQHIERYERLDDGSRPGHAKLRKTFDSKCGPGEIDFVRPFEIHSDDTMGERAAAIIVRSDSVGGVKVGRYDAGKEKYWQVPGPRQVRHPFY